MEVTIHCRCLVCEHGRAFALGLRVVSCRNYHTEHSSLARQIPPSITFTTRAFRYIFKATIFTLCTDLGMTSAHPDRARIVGDARAQAGHGTSVRGRAGDLVSAQGRNRKRKWENSQDEQHSMGGGEVQAPDGYVKTAGNRPGNRRPEHAQGPRKKATFEHTRLLPPKSFDADGSKQPEVESPRPPKA